MNIQVKPVEAKSILTKSNLPVGGYSVNPYIGCSHGCKYCYATFMRRFTNHPEPWGTFLDVKYWPEIKNPKKYEGKKIFIGSVTDPYVPEEEEYERTREFLEQMKDSGALISIATKSDLVLRDLDLIRSIPNARVSWSINTLDKDFRRDMDNAVAIERRLAAMKAFHDAGVRTTCFISPIFPGVTNVFAIMDRVMEQCNLIWLENLNLRGEYRTVILEYIRIQYPELTPLYDAIYRHKDRSYWEELDRQVATYAKSHKMPYVKNDDSLQRRFTSKPAIVNYFYHEEIKPKTARK